MKRAVRVALLLALWGLVAWSLTTSLVLGRRRRSLAGASPFFFAAAETQQQRQQTQPQLLLSPDGCGWDLCGGDAWVGRMDVPEAHVTLFVVGVDVQNQHQNLHQAAIGVFAEDYGAGCSPQTSVQAPVSHRIGDLAFEAAFAHSSSGGGRRGDGDDNGVFGAPLDWLPCTVSKAFMLHVVTCTNAAAFPPPPPANCSAGAVLLLRETRASQGRRVLKVPLCASPRAARPLRNVTACVAYALDGADRMAPQVAEFVEYHRMRGVEHFVVYDRTGAKAAYGGLLRRYVSEGVVTALRWPGVTRDRKNVERCQGFYDQLAAHMHCAFRQRGRSRWALFFDFDEFFWPSKEQLQQSEDGMASIFDFANAHLAKDPQLACVTLYRMNVGLGKGVPYPPPSAPPMLASERYTQVTQWRDNTKAMCIPERIWGTGIHRGVVSHTAFKRGKPVSDAIVVHYADMFVHRTGEVPSAGDFKQALDWKWLSELRRRVATKAKVTLTPPPS